MLRDHSRHVVPPKSYACRSTRNNLIPFSQEDGVNLNFTMLPKKLSEANYSS